MLLHLRHKIVYKSCLNHCHGLVPRLSAHLPVFLSLTLTSLSHLLPPSLGRLIPSLTSPPSLPYRPDRQPSSSPSLTSSLSSPSDPPFPHPNPHQQSSLKEPLPQPTYNPHPLPRPSQPHPPSTLPQPLLHKVHTSPSDQWLPRRGGMGGTDFCQSKVSNGLSSMVSSTFSSNYGGTDFSKRYAALQVLFPLYNFKNFKIFHERFSNGLSSRRGFLVSCETKNKFISAHQAEFQFAKALLMKIMASVNQIARDVICPGDRQANGTFQGLARRIQDAQSDGEDQGFLTDKQNSLIFQLSGFFLRKELHYRRIAV